jgi:uncharacterized protein (TIGR02594 family)
MTKELLGTICMEIGTTEIIGAEHNQRILEYHKATSLKATSDEVPWCSSFVNWALINSGLSGTYNAMARSFLNWGKVLDIPTIGCVVVLSRGKPPSGHVGFYLGRNGGGYIYVLGGNQNNMVRISVYSEKDVLGYRGI